MLGRFVTLTAIIALGSIGMANIADRSTGTDGAAAEKPADDGGWSARGGKGWSSARQGAGRAFGAVRIERAADSHFYAEADINGTRIRTMVDSGASVVALTRGDAEAIGIDVDRLPVTGTARTAGGDVPMRTVMLDRVDVGGIEARGVRAAVIEADMGVSLLGQSYLSRLGAVSVEGDTMSLR
jgi:aspartyl protease family protein